MFAPLFVSIITLHRGPRPRNITGFSAGLSFVQTLLFLSILFKVLNTYDESLYKYSPSFMVIIERKY